MKIKVIVLFSLLFVSYISTVSQPYNFRGIDSARKLLLLPEKNDTVFINTCFYIAEEYMNMNMYDSGQVWLNKIAAKLPLRKPSFFSFYLSVDQSETYYYNGLMQLDLHESQRLMRIAESLNDSILLATANNFLGLAYMNIDSISKSIPYFKNGIQYARQPPYPPQYLSASKPHHLYGNLSEAYYKLGKYDSAIQTACKAKQFALAIPWPRGIAVANNLLGLAYSAVHKMDSAILFQNQAIDIGLKNEQEDVALIAYSAAATCFEKINKNDTALALLKKGFLLMEEKPFINNLFRGQFLEDAIGLYKKLGQDKLLIEALEMKMKHSKDLAKKTDMQLTTIVKGSVANEVRAANLEVEEAKHKQALSNTRFIIALLALASMLILFFVNRRHQKKQLAEVEIRNKISRDLHDDIGATLSSIQIYGELAEKVIDNKPAHSKEMIAKIAVQVRELMSRMADVIWSIKPATDDKNSFTSRLMSFSNELLTPKDILSTFDIDEELGKKITDPGVRKNILLIVKEGMNNIAKYSNATKATITLRQQNQSLLLSISDNGKGFEINTAKYGNGIQNIRYRCEQLDGNCNIDTAPGKGVVLNCTFPIAIISHSL
jgi:signal transduction histidine kinase